jgi:uncharacterized protein (TIGR02172 family)
MLKGKLIGQGRTAEVFEWGEDKILKLFRNDFPKAVAENEYKVSMELCKKGVPMPQVFDLIEYESRVGIIYERIKGPTMMNLTSVKPWAISKQAKILAELHKTIQKNVDFELPSQKERLKENIASTELLTVDIKNKIFAVIEKLPSDSILCHGDFHPDNVLICEEEPIVIDWMTATSGNPLADIARTAVMFKFASLPEEKSYFERKIIDFFRGKFYSEYIKHYLKISGVSIKQVEEWELPVAAARLVEWLPNSEKMVLLEFINKKINEI